MSEQKRGVLARLIREPLVHFLAVGVALFGLNTLVNGAGPPPADVIVISQGRIAQLEESFRSISGRAPGEQELQALVDDFVLEEIGYREAVAMGLDADDTVVRRRMRQKLEFLWDDVAAIAEPTDAQLQQWFDAHKANYAAPEKRALRQVLASRDKRGEAIQRDAADMLRRLRAGADPSGVGDPSMLPEAVPLTTQVGVIALFGDDFAAAAFASKDKGWFGPVPSVFGLHLIEITATASPAAPALDDVREQVRNDFIADKRKASRATEEARLRKRYDVRIDWPKAAK